MARFQTRTEDDALRDMINRVVARTNISDITDTSSVKQLLRAVATEVGEAYFQSVKLRDLFDVRTAAGDDLDDVAKTILLGVMERGGSRPAIGTLQLSRPTIVGDEFVPVGTTATRLDGVSYRTIEQGQALAGFGTTGLITAVAVDSGYAGNTGSGTVTSLSGAAGSFNAVTNPTSFVAGRDRETDDEFRSRLIRYVDSLSRCTIGAIEVSVISIQNPDGSGQEVVFSSLYEDPLQPGEAILYIDDGAGNARQVTSATPSGTAVIGGTGATLTVSGPDMILFDPQANFDQALVSEFVVISNSIGNNTSFEEILEVIDSTSLRYSFAGVNEVDAFTYDTYEEVINSATGGEEFLNLEQRPIDSSLSRIIESTTRGVLALGTEVSINPTNGRLFFNPPLAVGERIFARYSKFIGLIPEVQRAVDGDPNDRVNFPGLRAAGVRVQVLSPNVVNISVEATIEVEDGFDRNILSAAAEQEVEFYINTLGISEDVVRNEIIERIMSITGVVDVNLTVPACTTAKIVVQDDQIARILAATLNIT